MRAKAPSEIMRKGFISARKHGVPRLFQQENCRRDDPAATTSLGIDGARPSTQDRGIALAGVILRQLWLVGELPARRSFSGGGGRAETRFPGKKSRLDRVSPCLSRPPLTQWVCFFWSGENPLKTGGGSFFSTPEPPLGSACRVS